MQNKFEIYKVFSKNDPLYKSSVERYQILAVKNVMYYFELTIISSRSYEAIVAVSN